jgi:hypothetical protein
MGVLLVVLIVANALPGSYSPDGGDADLSRSDGGVSYPEPGVAISPPMYDRGGWWDGGYGDGSMVASSSQLSVSVEDAEAKLDLVTDLVGELGGFVVSSSLERYDRAAPPVGYLTARVPAGEVDRFVRDVSALGVVLSRSTSASDVSGAFVELSTQLELLRTQEAELAALLDPKPPSPRPSELVEVVQRLSQVRAEIARMESELAAIERRVAFSLVSVTLLGSEVSLSDPGTWSVAAEFRAALAQLAGAGRSAVAVAARALVFGVPLVVVTLPVWLVARRRRARRRAADTAPSDL